MGRRSPSSETYVATPANSAACADPRSRSSSPMSSPTTRMKQRRRRMIYLKIGSIQFPTIVESAVPPFVSPPISSSICKAILLRLLFGFLWLCVKHWIPIERTPKCEEADGNDLEWTSNRAGVTPLRSFFKPRLNHAQVNLEHAEVICGKPECMKYFSNAKCLPAHVRTVHKCVQCEVCSSPQLKKNLKRHMQTHEEDIDAEVIHCRLHDCDSTFSSMSNLKIHVKAVHRNLRPFTCCESGCEKTFSYKHVRDNHEKSGAHVCIQGDFLEADRQFQSRSRGGRKRKAVDIGILTRKRVVPPGHGLESVFGTGAEYLRRMMSEDD